MKGVFITASEQVNDASQLSNFYVVICKDLSQLSFGDYSAVIEIENSEGLAHTEGFMTEQSLSQSLNLSLRLEHLLDQPEEH